MDPTRFLVEVNHHYAISGRAIKPCGAVWRIESPRGAYVLKPMGASADELRRLAIVLAKLAVSGFDGLEPPLVTITGKPFMEYCDRRYILNFWYEGGHPSFAVTQQLMEIGALYARFHQVAQAIGALDDWPLADCLERFSRRRDFLENLPCPPNPNRIDRAIQRWLPYFKEQSRLSCAGLKSLHFSEWLSRSKRKGFCHNDPAPRNIIMTNGSWRLIDFELSGFACFIAEYSTLLTRVLAVLDWNEGAVAAASKLLETYHRIRPLSQMEIRALPYLCCFPQRFWRLCSQRYEERLNWTEGHFARRLREVILPEPKRRLLLVRLFPELHTTL